MSKTNPKALLSNEYSMNKTNPKALLSNEYSMNKTNPKALLSNEYSMNIIESPWILPCLSNWRWEEGCIWEETGGCRERLTPRVLSYYKRLIKFLLLCNLKWFNPRFAPKKDSRVRRSMINFVEKFLYTFEETFCQQEEGLIVNYSLQGIMCLGIWCCLVDHVITWKFLSKYDPIKFLN